MRRSSPGYYTKPTTAGTTSRAATYRCICGYTTTMNKWFMSHQAHCPQVRHERYAKQREGGQT